MGKSKLNFKYSSHALGIIDQSLTGFFTSLTLVYHQAHRHGHALLTEAGLQASQATPLCDHTKWEAPQMQL